MSGDATGTLHFIDPAPRRDPAATRTSVEHLLGMPFGILPLAHGQPVPDDRMVALREVLEQSG